MTNCDFWSKISSKVNFSVRTSKWKEKWSNACQIAWDYHFIYCNLSAWKLSKIHQQIFSLPSAALQPNIIWIESNFVVQFYCFDMQKEIQSKPKRYIKNSKFNLFNFFFCEKIANEMELRKWFLSDYLYDCIQLRQSVSRFPIQFQNNTKLYELCMMSTTWNAKAYLKHAGT